MENHLLENFINSRVQYGELKYKVASESILFESKNQGLIDQVVNISQKHHASSSELDRHHILSNHINQLIYSYIRGDKDPTKQTQFFTCYLKKEEILDDYYNLSIASQSFKNMMSKNLNISSENTGLDEILKNTHIAIELDSLETKMLFKQFSIETEIKQFVRLYFFENLLNNKDFSHNLKLWNQKYKLDTQNAEGGKDVLVVFVYLHDWIGQLYQITDKLSKPHIYDKDKNQLVTSNYMTNLIPLYVFQELYDRNSKKFDTVYALQKQIKDHIFSFPEIHKIFDLKEPKIVLVEFLELLDWCEKIIEWENVMVQYIENLIQQTSSNSSLLEKGINDQKNSQKYLIITLQNYLTQWENQIDNKLKIKCYNINDETENDSFTKQRKDSVLYEVDKDAIYFYTEIVSEAIGSVFFEPTTVFSGIKIGQIIMDSPDIKNFHFSFDPSIIEHINLLWNSKELKPIIIKSLTSLIGILMYKELNKQNEKEQIYNIKL